jgi:parallel beta-helix repeat protein
MMVHSNAVRFVALLAIVIALIAPNAAFAVSCSNPITACDCTADSAETTYTLNGNITSAGTNCITIGASDITIDCQGDAINNTIYQGGNGIFNNGGYNGTTIKNCVITEFYSGIYIMYANNNTLTNNTFSSDNSGILLFSSSNNTIADNTANSNDNIGIFLNLNSDNNTVTNNIANLNSNYGIFVQTCSYNTITNNTANLNTQNGISITSSSNNNTLINNTVNSNGYYGIYVDSGSNNITNNTANSNTYHGIYIISSNNILANNTANLNNDTGIRIWSANNILTNNNANNNAYGVYFSPIADNSILTNNNATNNSIWDYYASYQPATGPPLVMPARSALNITVANLTTWQNLVSFTSQDIALKGLPTAEAPAENPTGYTSIGKYINATNNSATSWLYLNISYTDVDVASLAESTIGIWKYSSGNWTNEAFYHSMQYGVDNVSNITYANITNFSSIFGAFGTEPGGTYTPPADSFTSGLTFNGSVDGNLSGGGSYTTNQNVTFLDTSSGRKYFEAAANFSGGNVDLSNLTIGIATGKIAIDLSGVTGLYGTHTLWLPKTSDSGVYVCPNALTVSEVLGNCADVLSFAGPFPQTKSNVTVSVDDSYWKVEGLSGSGAGEKGPIQSGNLSATVLATAVITMIVDTVNFGFINVNQTLNATTAFGSGFQIDNDGNADINITISATALWTRSPYDSTSDKYRFACTTFNGTSCPSGSITSWTNMTIGGPTLVTANLPSASRTGVDIEITAPTDEPAGTRSSTVTLSASLA